MLRSMLVISMVALTAPALADGPDYNFIEGSYERIDLDGAGVNVDGDGFGIAGSVDVGEAWYLFASYNATDLDFSIDLDEFAIGGGYHTPLNENVDLFAKLAFVRADASAFGFSADDDGLGVSVGFRGITNDRFELEGALNYVDLGAPGDDFSVSGAAWYSFTPNVAAGFKAAFGDDVTRYGIGIRLYFDY